MEWLCIKLRRCNMRCSCDACRIPLCGGPLGALAMAGISTIVLRMFMRSGCACVGVVNTPRDHSGTRAQAHTVQPHTCRSESVVAFAASVKAADNTRYTLSLQFTSACTPATVSVASIAQTTGLHPWHSH